MELLRREVIDSLVKESAGPCVSIFLPTARGGSETRQGPIRLKNLLKKAEQKLAARDRRDFDLRGFLEPAQKLCENSGFWLHQGDGLAVFRSQDRFSYYRLPLRFEELVVVTERFHLKPLLRMFTEDGRFYLLSLSKNGVRFLECTRHGAREIELGTEVPRSLQELRELAGVQRHTTGHSVSASLHGLGHGTRAGENEKQELKEYFRLVDRAVREIIRDDNAPVVLAGVEYELALYREASSHPALIAGGVMGSPEGRRISQLREEAWNLVEPHFRNARAEAARRYEESVGTSRASNVLEELVPAACTGRVERLFVAVGRQRWGVYNPQTQRVKIREQAHAGDEDLLDLAAIQTFLHRGAVYAVTPEEVPGGRSLAATLRY